MARSDVRVVEIDGEGVLWDESRDMYYGLNARGMIAWHMLRGGASVAQVADKLMLACGMDMADRDVVVADVKEMFEHPMRLSLVE